MQRCLICFGTTEAHTGKIAEYLGYALYKRGITPVIEACPTKINVASFQALVVGGAVQAGQLHPSVLSFIAKHRQEFDRKPSFLFTAGLRPFLTYSQICDEEQRTGEWMESINDWKPDAVGSFEGALWYRRYGIYERWRMRNKARRLGLDTDTRRNYEYTDWSAVDRFAEKIVGALSQTKQGSRPTRVARAA